MSSAGTPATLRVALAQIASGTDPGANLATLARRTAEAADAGASLVLFPEATMCRFGVPLGPVAEPLDGRWADGVRAAAARHGVTVVAGMFCPAGERVTNTLVASGPGGDAHYHKIHLYDAFGFVESRTVAPGSEPVVIDVEGVGVGLSTCYDVRFPELYVDLARRGARLLTVHASWGDGPGKASQWRLLARARALDATSALAAVGQARPGSTPGPAVAAQSPTGIGNSVVCSPTGEVLAQAGDAPELLLADVALDPVRAARESIPVLANRAGVGAAR